MEEIPQDFALEMSSEGFLGCKLQLQTAMCRLFIRDSLE